MSLRDEFELFIDVNCDGGMNLTDPERELIDQIMIAITFYENHAYATI